MDQKLPGTRCDGRVGRGVCDRERGAGRMTGMTVASPLGPLTLTAEGGALTGLWLPGQRGCPQTLTPGDAPVLDAARDWLLRYFAGDAPDPRALPLAPQGSAFAREVWRLLLAIPYGRATSYGALAAQLAAQRGLAHMSAQAVGGAVGRNPIAIIIPCHRVLGAQGQLTGYAGGLAAKRFLLAHEGIGYRGSSNDGIVASHQREAGRDKG